MKRVLTSLALLLALALPAAVFAAKDAAKDGAKKEGDAKKPEPTVVTGTVSAASVENDKLSITVDNKAYTLPTSVLVAYNEKNDKKVLSQLRPAPKKAPAAKRPASRAESRALSSLPLPVESQSK